MSSCRRALILLISVSTFGSTLLSCGHPPPSRPALAVYDSIGIEIVDFDLDQVPEAGSVEPRPDWIFGDSLDRQDEVALRGVGDAKLLSDGRVALINGMAQEVLLVDPDSDEWQRLGGKGQGPGEFEFIASVSAEEGRIGVYDAYRKLWTTFRDGEFLGSEKVPPIGVPGIAYPEVIIPDGAGFLVGDAYLPSGSMGGVPTRRNVLVARVEGDLVDTLATIPGDIGIPKGVGLSPLPFGASYGITKGDSGVWMGDSALPQLMFWNGGGDLRRIVRWTSSRDRNLTGRRIRAFRDRIMAGQPARIRSSIRQTFKNTVFPSEIPAWGNLIMGGDGILWVCDDPGPEVQEGLDDPHPAQLWWGIGQTGRPVGRLVSPAGLQVTGFGGDFLIGIHRDALGVETVRRHRITPMGGSDP